MHFYACFNRTTEAGFPLHLLAPIVGLASYTWTKGSNMLNPIFDALSQIITNLGGILQAPVQALRALSSNLSSK